MTFADYMKGLVTIDDYLNAKEALYKEMRLGDTNIPAGASIGAVVNPPSEASNRKRLTAPIANFIEWKK